MNPASFLHDIQYKYLYKNSTVIRTPVAHVFIFILINVHVDTVRQLSVTYRGISRLSQPLYAKDVIQFSLYVITGVPFCYGAVTFI